MAEDLESIAFRPGSPVEAQWKPSGSRGRFGWPSGAPARSLRNNKEMSDISTASVLMHGAPTAPLIRTSSCYSFDSLPMKTGSNQTSTRLHSVQPSGPPQLSSAKDCARPPHPQLCKVGAVPRVMFLQIKTSTTCKGNASGNKEACQSGCFNATCGFCYL